MGLADAFKRLQLKCATIFSCRDEAKDMCGLEQRCVGLDAGMDRCIHGTCLIWQRGFLLLDAGNTLNKGNRIGMCWTVQHKWPSGVRFTFKCYQHWATILASWSDWQ